MICGLSIYNNGRIKALTFFNILLVCENDLRAPFHTFKNKFSPWCRWHLFFNSMQISISVLRDAPYKFCVQKLALSARWSSSEFTPEIFDISDTPSIFVGLWFFPNSLILSVSWIQLQIFYVFGNYNIDLGKTTTVTDISSKWSTENRYKIE